MQVRCSLFIGIFLLPLIYVHGGINEEDTARVKELIGKCNEYKKGYDDHFCFNDKAKSRKIVKLGMKLLRNNGNAFAYGIKVWSFYTKNDTNYIVVYTLKDNVPKEQTYQVEQPIDWIYTYDPRVDRDYAVNFDRDWMCGTLDGCTFWLFIDFKKYNIEMKKLSRLRIDSSPELLVEYSNEPEFTDPFFKNMANVLSRYIL